MIQYECLIFSWILLYSGPFSHSLVGHSKTWQLEHVCTQWAIWLMYSSSWILVGWTFYCLTNSKALSVYTNWCTVLTSDKKSILLICLMLTLKKDSIFREQKYFHWGRIAPQRAQKLVLASAFYFYLRNFFFKLR